MPLQLLSLLHLNVRELAAECRYCFPRHLTMCSYCPRYRIQLSDATCGDLTLEVHYHRRASSDSAGRAVASHLCGSGARVTTADCHSAGTACVCPGCGRSLWLCGAELPQSDALVPSYFAAACIVPFLGQVREDSSRECCQGSQALERNLPWALH